MIDRSSRYYEGPLAQVKHKYTESYTIAVFKPVMESRTISYVEYVWVDGDTLGSLAASYLGNSKYWWEILEVNTNISDPFNIPIGTVLKVPHASK
jgi:nucleoid-associated protein YgaU